MTEDYLWHIVQNVAKSSNCKKRHVGCVILDENDTIVSTGYNWHVNGICDCADKSTALHAEEVAVANIPDVFKNDDSLVAYINHKPCDKCRSLLEEHTSGITVNTLSKRLDQFSDDVKHDPVRPKHYADVDGVPTIRFFEEATSFEGYKGYLQLTAIKYLYRLDNKDEPLINIRKAKWFVEKLEEHLDGPSD